MSLLIGVAVKVTLLLLAGTVVVLALRRASAASRHLAWTLCLLALLAQLPLSALLPRVEIPVWPPAAAIPPAAAMAEAAPEPAVSGGVGVSLSPAPSTPVGRRVQTRDVATAIWLAGIGVFLLRMAVGARLVRRIVREARPAGADLVALARDTAGRLGWHGELRLLESERVTVPVVYGMFRPVVLLPGEARTWAGERLRAVLLHELAHIERRDCLVHMLAGIARAAYWPHPLVWWAYRRLRAEAEQASDDRVVQSGTDGPQYAQTLLELARSLRSAPRPLAVVAVVERSSLEDRLVALLDVRRRRGRPSRGVRWCAAAVSLVLMAGAASAELGRQAVPASAIAPPAVPMPRPGVAAATAAAPGPTPAAMPAAPSVTAPPPAVAEAAPAVSAATKGEITGTVVDDQARPVPAFTVEALAEPGATRQVEVTQVGKPDGTFRLAVPPGTYVLSIRAAGYKLKLSWPIEVAAGRTADAGRLPLEVGGIVHGIVTDLDGRPIRGAGIGAVGGSRGANLTIAAVTDDAGRFELAGIRPGPATLVATHEAYATSAPVEIAVDARGSNGPVALIVRRGGRIEGVVRGRTHPVGRGPRVHDRFGAARQVAVGPDGKFTLEHVTPGPNTLSFIVEHDDGPPTFYMQTVEVEEGETAKPTIVLGLVAMRGKVTAEGKPVSGYRLQLHREAKGQAALTSTETVTEEDGSYSLLVPRPGPYRISLQGPGGSPRLRRGPTVLVPGVPDFAQDITLGPSVWQ